ncbi:MAG: hypothetical protein KAS32_02975 [Candidatus Peribacteraceae bacterium]|nr:hypothetical protein [Candidatus Peribacteraceae bacterium]
MAETRKQTIVMMCSIVGCIVTLITCGTLIGGMKTDVVHLKAETVKMCSKLDSIETRQDGMATKQAFLEGVVSTQLSNIQTSVNKIEKRVDHWEVSNGR